MFEILYQDNDLIAINKPSGWLVHRSWLDKHETVVVMQTLRDQIGQHVFPVHRLDRPTSGVLLFALSSEIARLMSEQFATKQIEKTYHAIVRGYVEGEATIDYPLVEELDKIADKFSDSNKPAQDAVTTYRGISKIEIPIKVGKFDTARYSFVELKPKTGRKHQLRRHMKHIFHPILGDSKHGDLHQNRAFAEFFSIKRLMLHASKLQITHPINHDPIIIEANLDQQWQDILLKFI
ncbi:tRNA pseudouridine(65) synthase TruC [Gilliamella apicola]|uniref:tRNA pseudouridine(65) synthase TruC n=1 Tax=Gilliamella apicola TaxID=1196095 RepID=UPI000A0613E6|nr:tRNA pseudouridine(65) synthase TruC [Gilliamella apicola]ORF44622.1 tRNA pseudouridine(65) synthase TruC [Gilliamella apicola]ORF48750.1 tRNA pseudouridine(65) synthase TruC [Gilliamella apicola]ORF51432.1 tRNA pseudouridine(65) synthase TruC [Gilliamella apicola]ORF51784.1 tRNA pseudouridine(65) synthase TruC [Gilliamella apicola]ORF52513.1 tRNA pseudouridine(65) synthase TruC [Gilliamella apicola]